MLIVLLCFSYRESRMIMHARAFAAVADLEFRRQFNRLAVIRQPSRENEFRMAHFIFRILRFRNQLSATVPTLPKVRQRGGLRSSHPARSAIVSAIFPDAPAARLGPFPTPRIGVNIVPVCGFA